MSSTNENKFSRKENRDAVVNNSFARILGLLGNAEVQNVFENIKVLQDYYEEIKSSLEKTISDLKKKMNSIDFLQERISKLYLKDQKFTHFLLHLIEG